MEDGLYFLGQWVADVEVVLNLQANDLTSPATLQANYANAFTLPDTTVLRSLLQNAEQLDSGGRDPYRLIPAKLIEEGETVFTGFAALQSFQSGWKVILSGAARGLFDQLADISLRDLDLSRYDHPWTIEAITDHAGNTEGVVYPAIDYGSMDNGTFAQDTVTAATYAHSIIVAMLTKVGYRPGGAWLSDALIKRIVLPFVEEEPTAYDDEWKLSRQARVTVTGIKPIPPFGNVSELLQLNRDNEPLSGWIDGKQNNYKAESYRYVCDVAMRLRVQAFQQFALQVDAGAVEVMLIIEKNGQNVAQEYQSFGGPYNIGLNRPTLLNLNETITCRAGDQLQIRFVLKKRTTIVQHQQQGFFSEEFTWASFEPDITVQAGDVWPVARNLPDMTCADLLKTIALANEATYDIDETARTLTLRPLDEVIANEANATDLSHCVEESTEPENAVIISPYGQKNLLKWKEQDDKTLIGYGDGVITCNAQNIPVETTLFELPFAAVVDSKNTIAGYGNPPFIETRTVSGSGTSVQVQKKSSPPRLLLVEPTKPVTVTVNVVTLELTVRPTPVPLTACWWYTRPIGLALPENKFSLAFDRPAGATTNEQTLIQRRFKALIRVLRRPRQLSVPAYLRPVDIATLNLYAPVRLRAVRAGSLDLNDNYYYLNSIKNYRAGVGCTLTLIAY